MLRGLLIGALIVFLITTTGLYVYSKVDPRGFSELVYQLKFQLLSISGQLPPIYPKSLTGSELKSGSRLHKTDVHAWEYFAFPNEEVRITLAKPKDTTKVYLLIMQYSFRKWVKKEIVELSVPVGSTFTYTLRAPCSGRLPKLIAWREGEPPDGDGVRLYFALDREGLEKFLSRATGWHYDAYVWVRTTAFKFALDVREVPKYTLKNIKETGSPVSAGWHGSGGYYIALKCLNPSQKWEDIVKGADETAWKEKHFRPILTSLVIEDGKGNTGKYPNLRFFEFENALREGGAYLYLVPVGGQGFKSGRFVFKLPKDWYDFRYVTPIIMYFPKTTYEHKYGREVSVKGVVSRIESIRPKFWEGDVYCTYGSPTASILSFKADLSICVGYFRPYIAWEDWEGNRVEAGYLAPDRIITGAGKHLAVQPPPIKWGSDVVIRAEWSETHKWWRVEFLPSGTRIRVDDTGELHVSKPEEWGLTERDLEDLFSDGELYKTLWVEITENKPYRTHSPEGAFDWRHVNIEFVKSKASRRVKVTCHPSLVRGVNKAKEEARESPPPPTPIKKVMIVEVDCPPAYVVGETLTVHIKIRNIGTDRLTTVFLKAYVNGTLKTDIKYLRLDPGEEYSTSFTTMLPYTKGTVEIEVLTGFGETVTDRVVEHIPVVPKKCPVPTAEENPKEFVEKLSEEVKEEEEKVKKLDEEIKKETNPIRRRELEEEKERLEKEVERKRRIIDTLREAIEKTPLDRIIESTRSTGERIARTVTEVISRIERAISSAIDWIAKVLRGEF